MKWLNNLIFSPEEEDTATDDNKIKMDFLNTVEYKDVDIFHLNGLKCYAKVVKVYDGDTIHCIFFINNKAFKFRVRLANIDTAEKKSSDPAEKAWADEGIKYLKKLINGKLVYLKCYKWDKYGRLLGEIFEDDKSKKSFNQQMIEQGYAYEYHGKKRKVFREWAPWIAWLNYPENRPSDKQKPVDNIEDLEVYESIDSEVDYQESNNLEEIKIRI